ncbi:TPA: hypothetical protein HA241_03950 [Candidatus Woesearchaeota archaeon]|nr:hypothetical protein [Candidatus Woesearchaeota archaeon]
MVVFNHITEKNILPLVRSGFSKQKGKTPYETLRLVKEGVTLVLYNSGKLVVQGKKERVDLILKDLPFAVDSREKKKAVEHVQDSQWIIGSDEALKGDTFGGLVVAAVRADEKIREKLRKLGVVDSKLLSDRQIFALAPKVKELVSCEIKSLLPEEYNVHRSLTALLNTLHKECAAGLGSGIHVVDKYPGCAVGDVREEKAESKYVEVAAASILARAAALEQFDFLSSLAGFVVPKGSTHVHNGLVELQRRDLEFRRFVKLHFKNVQEFLRR